MHHFIVVISLLISSISYSQLKEYSFEEADSLSESKPKVIFLHTSWCGICHQMENTTFKSPEVINELNNDFYFIPFDGEHKDDVQFLGHQFTYIPHGTRSGTHQLAKALGTIDGQLAYPTICVLNSNNEIIFQIASKLTTKELLTVLDSLKE